VTESFSADWLTLREPFDAAARSVGLARRFADALPVRPRILDLGAGTGSMMRWLRPIIGREQSWTLADADGGLLERVRDAETLIVDLAQAPDALPFGAVDGVVCSALLDLVSEAWLHRLVAALRTPFFACLTVDGDDSFTPPHPGDDPVLGAFRADQVRDKGFGPAVGTGAPAALETMLTAQGCTVMSEKSDWDVLASEAAMLRELVLGHARVAGDDAWERDRLEQIDREKFAIRIGHRDILALPV
jgi:hypothetical protein